MKAVVNVEFFVSVIVFVSTIFFLIISIVSVIPQFHEGSALISLRSRSFAVSEALLLDEGAPRNWDSASAGSIKRIGLSTKEKYVLSLKKIDKLKAMCDADYENVRNLVAGDPKYAVTIKVTDVDTDPENPYMECAPSAISAVLPKSVIRRYAVLENGNKVILEIGVA